MYNHSSAEGRIRHQCYQSAPALMTSGLAGPAATGTAAAAGLPSEQTGQRQ